MKLLSPSFFLIILLSISGYAKGLNPYQNTSRTQVIMGTFATISLPLEYAHKISSGFTYLRELESYLSSYSDKALLYKLNKNRKIPQHPMLHEILQKSLLYHKNTDGYFDITIGSMSKKLYRFGEDERLPTLHALDVAPLGMQHIVFNKSSIELQNNITLDLGGIGKGYAIDKLSQLYASQGLTKGKIALSGDIRCFDRCEVSIQDPFRQDSIMTTLQTNTPHVSISTSGTYRRYVQNKTHHHLMNPKTKRQGKDFVSVTIISQANNTLCDAIATAVSTMPKEIAIPFVKSQQKLGYILVTHEGEKILGNLEKFVHRKK
ncbi:MAG: Thiamin biosynthesis lipoprotein ApbE [uncultured Sulfurovum sp.]|uniref:FAD:protein FMN transferase n=1 Tax=uncultured Sulfurovum sp. TaxID=269237 RepID=A0A6S6SG72_9BACT|nr:MAG: Thiamin biosynthesis lipoprotein ApbE [uncultured Sulfurovum sp.]